MGWRMGMANGNGAWCGGAVWSGGVYLVVLVLYRRPLHSLLPVFHLFRLEHEYEEELLQLLVCKIDRELLERVIRSEELKAKDV